MLTLAPPPTVTQGQFLLASVAIQSFNGANATAATITVPPGWTPLRNDSCPTDLQMSLAYKFAGPTDTSASTYTWNFSQVFTGSGGIVSFNDINSFAPIEIGSFPQCGSDSTTLTAPSITTMANNSLSVLVFGITGGAQFARLAGYLEAFQYGSTEGGPDVSNEFALIPASGTATGDQSTTATMAGDSIGYQLALAPPRPTPTPIVSPTPTPAPTASPRPTPTPKPSPMPTPAPTPVPTPTPTLTPTSTATPTPAATATQVATPTPTPIQAMAGGTLVISTGSLKFRPRGIDTGSSNLKLVIKNIGKGTLNGSVDLSGLARPFSGSGAGSFTLTHKQKTTVEVDFAPTLPGSFKGTVAVSSSDPNAPFVDVSVSGSGLAGVYRLAKKFNFGSLKVGETRNKTLVLRNTGRGVLHGNVSSSGLAGGPFSVVSGSGGFAISHDKSLKIVVQFAPTVSGHDSAELTVTTDDPKHLSASAELIGIGT